MQTTTIRPAPRDIAILLFDRFSNHCLANAVEPFRAANMLSRKELYRWQFVTWDGTDVVSSSGLPVTPGTRLADHPGGDYLFLLPSYGYAGETGPDKLVALREAARRFTALVGMDCGAWLMAAAGLLDGHRATIHWDEIGRFAETFPEVDTVEDRFVRDGDRITCGGATTTFELTLDMIRRQHGPMLRLEVAALFMHGERSDLLDPLLRPTSAQRVDAAVALMRRHIEEPLPLAAIAGQVGATQKTLEGLFKKSLRMTPRTVYRRLRLREARRLVKHSRLSVAEIAVRCGYQNASAMTRAFTEEFGLPPRDLRMRGERTP
ncbi:MAG: helix-turn-helix domain-containing protein [Alphaproteobacteria bacterium]|nr:helix-turn-helix domain-containing protein [Alphaproteobacteria bacterium]